MEPTASLTRYKEKIYLAKSKAFKKFDFSIVHRTPVSGQSIALQLEEYYQK